MKGKIIIGIINAAGELIDFLSKTYFFAKVLINIKEAQERKKLKYSRLLKNIKNIQNRDEKIMLITDFLK